MKKITIANGIVLKKGKILLLKKFSKEYYETPGGKTEENEKVEDCLVRELQEEIGIEVISFEKFLEPYKLYFEDKEIANNSFLITKFSGKPRIVEKDIFEKLIWVTAEEAQKLPLAPNIPKIIEELEKIKNQL